MSSEVALWIEDANAEVVRRLVEPEVTFVGVDVARNVIPGMHDHLILHSGPPIEWELMAPVQQESLIGAAIYEQLAADPKDARHQLTNGDIEFAPCHHHSTVGAMTGVTSASMAMLIVENDEFGNRAFCKVVERELQFGIHNADVFANLGWLREVLGPAIDGAIREIGGLKLIHHTSQALHMGDECHNRNVAATALLVRKLAAPIARTAPVERIPEILDYFNRIDQAYLGLAMAAAKALTDAAHGVDYSTVVTALARNGVEVGVRVSGLGDEWFVGPAQVIDGAFGPGYGPDDATPDIGDSAIVETIGLGAMALANALTAGAIAGGTADEAIQKNRTNMEIAAGTSRSFTIPVLDFVGTPTGIDIRAVARKGIVPYVLTGIAGNKAPWGRVGAGIVHPPLEPFVAAVKAFASKATK
jgi:hypothetical protein|tara:strand:+ start:1322 stop:2569 length:1248 start_codon:yes stop_codon:yes gene_type:complete